MYPEEILCLYILWNAFYPKKYMDLVCSTRLGSKDICS